MPTENTQAASSAQTENQNAENAQNAQSTQSTQQSEEKKYTDTEMNNISKKNSEKAVSKLLKELGITDREKAKQILAQAAEQERAAAENGQSESSIRESELATRLADAERRTQNAVLENILLTRKVKAEKISRAVRLVDIESCLDDDGKFSREKAENAVTQLLTEWPELSPTDDGAQVGFTVGADSSSQTSAATQQKKTIQKSWNRFNT